MEFRPQICDQSAPSYLCDVWPLLRLVSSWWYHSHIYDPPLSPIGAKYEVHFGILDHFDHFRFCPIEKWIACITMLKFKKFQLISQFSKKNRFSIDKLISWKHWLFVQQKRSKYDSQIPFQQRSKPLFWLMSILYHIIRFSRVFSSLSWLDSVLKVITGMSVTSYKKRHSKASRCEVSHGLEVQKCDHRRRMRMPYYAASAADLAASGRERRRRTDA